MNQLLMGLWWFSSGFAGHFALKHGLARQWEEMVMDLLMAVGFGLMAWMREDK